MKASVASRKTQGVVSDPAAAGAAKTRTFLVHCRGRASLISARRPRGAAGGPTAARTSGSGDAVAIGAAADYASARGRAEVGALAVLVGHRDPHAVRRLLGSRAVGPGLAGE